MKKRDLEDWELAECTALKNAVDAYNAGKPRAERLSQGKIADALGMNQGSVSSYLNGVNALNARVAGVIAGLIKVPVESFSPRLAKEIAEMAAPIAVENQSGSGGLAVAEQTGTYGGAAAKVMEMLSKHGKNLTDSAQQRLLQAVSETLTEVKSGNVIPGNFSRSARVQDGDILIPQYDVRASMGHGQVPADYVEFVRNVVVNGLQLEKLGLEYTSTANLSIITGWGESMAPTIKSKDPVIVDRGVNEYVDDGIYVLTWEGHLFIKRVHKARGGMLKIISDSRPNDPETVSPNDVLIHAKVLLVWNASRL